MARKCSTLKWAVETMTAMADSGNTEAIGRIARWARRRVPKKKRAELEDARKMAMEVAVPRFDVTQGSGN